MAPPPFLSITGISWRIELRTPHTLMSKMRRYSASVACSSRPFHSTPALLNAMSSRPNLSTANLIIAFTSASLATSARTNAASPPSFLISATTCAPSFSRRPLKTTFAPARAKAIAVVLPMPEVPPVTNATLPSNVLLFIVFLSFLFSNLRNSSIYKQFHSGNVACVLVCQEHHCPSNFIRCAEPTERDSGGHHLLAFLTGLRRTQYRTLSRCLD